MPRIEYSKLITRSLMWFIFIALIESTIRKYLFPSTLIILLKYIAILPLLWIAISLPLLRLFIIFSSVFIVTISSLNQLSYALYDWIGLFAVPSVLFVISRYTRFPRPASSHIVTLIFYAGLFNSIVIIFQSLLGPSHWISQTVDQQFTLHVFGGGHKAVGIFARSQPLVSVGAIAAFPFTRYSRNLLCKYATYLIVLLSAVANLPSRTYFFGIILYFIVSLLYGKNLRFIVSFLVVLSLITGALSLLFENSLFVDDSIFSNSLSANRTFDDFDSAASRFLDLDGIFYQLTNLSLPLVGGPGLGATVGNNPLTEPSLLPVQCQGYLIEPDFSRIICAFGYSGFIYLFIRSYIFFTAFLPHLLPSHAWSSNIKILSLYLMLITLNQPHLKINDVVIGIILLTSLLAALISLERVCSSPVSPRTVNPCSA